MRKIRRPYDVSKISQNKKIRCLSNSLSSNLYY